MYVNVDRITDPDRSRQVQQRLLTDVREVVEDTEAMIGAAGTLADALDAATPPLPAQEVAEGTALLRWLAVCEHPLRREITTTLLVNEVVDRGGITYCYRLAEELSVSAPDAVRAYFVAVAVFDLGVTWQAIATMSTLVYARPVRRVWYLS
jgi:NAD-specific glutamate dehydrogenase